MSLNELAEKIRLSNVARGFHPPEGEETNLDRNLMMIVGELSEAQEELRAGFTFDQIYFRHDNGSVHSTQSKEWNKPEGFSIELADSLIRTLGLMAELGLDIDLVVHMKMEYNNTRSYKHGNKAF